MQEQTDIVVVDFSLTGKVELDLERAQDDPAWQAIARHFNLADREERKKAITQYVCRYLSQDVLLTNNPATCGPADIYSTDASVRG